MDFDLIHGMSASKYWVRLRFWRARAFGRMRGFYFEAVDGGIIIAADGLWEFAIEGICFGGYE